MSLKHVFNKTINRVIFVVLSLIIVLPTSLILLQPKAVRAANFQMMTGYYVGNGQNGLTVSGLDFAPDFVIIKSADNGNEIIFKTSAMPSDTSLFLMGLAANTDSVITLTGDGFTLSDWSGVNTTNFLYHWIAFGGSDCTATGNFCVGSYTGNGSNPRTITTGFEPEFTLIKRDNTAEANFKTPQMQSNEGNFFTTTLPVTNGNLYGDPTSTGFTVGSTNNTTGGVYYYVAFEHTTGIMNSGQYTGNGADNRDITGIGFKPNWVMLKNSNSATSGSRRMSMSTVHHYGDAASWMGVNNSNSSNVIQGLNSDGFQVGSDATANENGSNFYWIAWGDSVPDVAQDEPFDMAFGTYTGTGSTFDVSSLTFAPDLVIIKDIENNFSVFRTKLMGGDTTAYLGTNLADFTGGITSLNSNGFSIGTSTIVNSTGNTYHWQAFGNAWNPHTHTGSNQFAIGAYRGNAVDNRLIDNLVFTPDFIAMKSTSAHYAAWKTPAMADDISAFFRESSDAANVIQRILPGQNAVELGTASSANNSGAQIRWFAFKAGTQFSYGGYTGDGNDDRNITGVGFDPDWVMVKRSTSTGGVHRPRTISADNSLYFGGTTAAGNNIQTTLTDGFQVGSGTSVNALTGQYYYAAWKMFVPEEEPEDPDEEDPGEDPVSYPEEEDPEEDPTSYPVSYPDEDPDDDPVEEDPVEEDSDDEDSEENTGGNGNNNSGNNQNNNNTNTNNNTSTNTSNTSNSPIAQVPLVSSPVIQDTVIDRVPTVNPRPVAENTVNSNNLDKKDQTLASLQSVLFVLITVCVTGIVYILGTNYISKKKASL